MMRLAVLTLLVMATSHVQADQIRGTFDEPLLAEVAMLGTPLPARPDSANPKGLVFGPTCMLPASSNYQAPRGDTIRDNQVAFTDFLALEKSFVDRSRQYIERSDSTLNLEDFRLIGENLGSREQILEVPESQGVVFGTIGLFFGMLTLCFAVTNK